MKPISAVWALSSFVLVPNLGKLAQTETEAEKCACTRVCKKRIGWMKTTEENGIGSGEVLQDTKTQARGKCIVVCIEGLAYQNRGLGAVQWLSTSEMLMFPITLFFSSFPLLF